MPQRKKVYITMSAHAGSERMPCSFETYDLAVLLRTVRTRPATSSSPSRNLTRSATRVERMSSCYAAKHSYASTQQHRQNVQLRMLRTRLQIVFCIAA